MNNKRIITAMLSAALCLSLLAGCGKSTQTEQSSTASQQSTAASTQSTVSEASKNDEKSTADDTGKKDTSDNNSEVSAEPTSKTYTLTVRDQGKSEAITATFFNTMTGKSEDIQMQKTGEGEDYFLYSCDAENEKYNMVHLSYGDTTTEDVAFDRCISGWYLWNDELLPYTVGKEPKYTPKFDTQVFQFNGTDKNVYIWTPEDYDAKSADKYATIYILDGQTVLSTEISHDLRCWNVAEHADSMSAATGQKAIVVAIDTLENRGDDMIPDFAKMVDDGSNSQQTGTAFANFLCDTIMPYVQENYNVYTDALHTSISGSSLAGLESFYIGVEHPDKFGTIGAFSPSFWAFVEDDWKAYFESKQFDSNMPFLYVYAGGFYTDTGHCDEPVYNMLLESGYPKDKAVFSKYEPGEHQVQYWKNIYPEFLEAMTFQKVAALECGVPVTYQDKTLPKQAESLGSQPEESVGEDTRPDHIKNYIFFDNSEVQWEQVYAYWWGGIPVNKATGEQNYGNPDWPGIPMEKVEGTDLYRVAVPLNISNIIFNTGVTDDKVAEGVIAYQTADLIFNDAACSGKIFKIDTSKEAKKGHGIEKTKYKYPDGSWSDYTE